MRRPQLRRCPQARRRFRKPSVLSHDSLLVSAAQHDDCPATATWLRADLRRALRDEVTLRYQTWAAGVRRSRMVPAEQVHDVSGCVDVLSGRVHV